ncbi:E3 ubiquitin-protein ligase pellino homolog 2 isoform X2 [Phoca vitulina]|uniref:E3 ubiquitin-protein ligase pellino homolog 2 isoform X2 n=1 Tax=Phoca vitulina TaxID=9720 RepID=UPI001395DA8E|nr:E3 ubiquitin-protein ligase pellino homolog 2 isoform X2 [Phoca vitulina]
MFSPGQEEHCAPNKEPVKYGELVVLGYNGALPNGDRGRRKSRFALYKRPKANGVKPSTVHVISTPQASKAISCKGQHSISYTLSRNQTVVVEYTHDKDTDMFQVGRSTESPIDFVVTDTISGSQNNDEAQITQSTISRFACRIVCDRNEPYTARIFAAGFDSSKNIFLGEKAAKWKNPDGHMDGLTTNGVLVMHPRGGFTEESQPGVWREISVCGDVYTLRETRWKARPTSCRTAPSSTCAGPRFSGGRQTACSTLRRRSTSKPCGRRSTPRGRSVPWGSTPWPSPASTGRRWWRRSSPGPTSAAATCTATTTGATGATRRPTSESVPCAGLWAPTFRSGSAARRASMSTPDPPLTLSPPVDTCAQRSPRSTGRRSRCLTELTRSTPPALSVPRSWLGSRTASN